jgi:uncharacterized protein YcbX
MQIGTVAALWRYPIKSLQREELPSATVHSDGIAGDRVQALIVADDRHARAGKPLRGKENNRLHTVSRPEKGISLALLGGVITTLAPPDRYFDARPVSLLFDTWLADVAELVGYELDPLRYRPNIFAHAAPGFDRREPAMLGMTLAIGTVVLTVVEPINRCVTTTYDVETGESDLTVLRAVAQARNNIVGIYCTVAQPGEMARGDTIVQQ